MTDELRLVMGVVAGAPGILYALYCAFFEKSKDAKQLASQIGPRRTDHLRTVGVEPNDFMEVIQAKLDV